MEPVLSVAPYADEPSIGWGVIEHIESWLVQPDGDEAGQPFQLTREQLDFVLRFYRLDPADQTRLLYRRGVLRRSKGWGKSPVMAALAFAELTGPVRPSGEFASDGTPLGRPVAAPWIVIAGYSEKQTANTLDALRGMLTTECAEHFGLDIGLSRILLEGGRGKIVPVSASAATAEGARPTFAVLDETHHWTATNGGEALARTIARNLAKARGGDARLLETTNAHVPGHGSVAEVSYNAWRAIAEGRSAASGLLYDSREAPAGVDLSNDAELTAGLRAAYGDAAWIDLDRIKGEVLDPALPPADARRFYLNQIVAAEDGWLAPAEWDRNRAESIAPLEPGDEITLGFDGSLTDDSTVLAACRVADGSVWLLGAWERPTGPGEWAVPKDQVRDAVEYARETYRVRGFFADVAWWDTDVDRWRDSFAEHLEVAATSSHRVGWDMRTRRLETVRGLEALHLAVCEGEVPWRQHETLQGKDGASILTRHMMNARRRPNRHGMSVAKATPDSPHKIDAVMSVMLARTARTRLLARRAEGKKPKRVARLYGF